MIGGVFVRALNENRTRDLPLRRRTLYPLSYKGVASFRGFAARPTIHASVFSTGHTGQTSINPSWERFSCGGSRSREDSNLRGLAPLLLSGQSHSTALPLLH